MTSGSRQLRGLAVITGATGGVGLEIAKGLAQAGYGLVLGARSPARGGEALAKIQAVAAFPAAVRQGRLDLGSLDSVADFAASLPEQPIDRLVLNAALMVTSRKETDDGFEMMFGTNVLGHFALITQVLDKVLAAKAPRVVTQSSESHRAGKLNLQDLQHKADFSSFGAYNDSKQAQHILAVELDRRHPHAGSVVCQPGWVRSDLGRDMANASLIERGAYAIGNVLIGQTPAEGARSALKAALDDDVPGAATGLYITPGKFRHLRGEPVVAEAAPQVLDTALGQGLWDAAASAIKSAKDSNRKTAQ
jgi:NAD(P)-dependent dehydrogenase (short-subunit alcohol dehydrogenase family)